MTSADLYKMITVKFAAPEWVTMPEVRNATGYQRRTRYADAIAVSTYPSRGVDVHGFEIKVSKSDWKRELVDPDKAEEIARYCDYWWIVAPPNIVDVKELPGKWGLLVAKSNGLHKAASAHKLTAEPLDRLFLASMLRSAYALVEAAERRSPSEKATGDARTKGYEEGKAHGEKVRGYRMEQLQHLETRVKEFAAQSGIDLDSYRPTEELASAIKIAEVLARDSRMLRTLHAALGAFLGGSDADVHD